MSEEVEQRIFAAVVRIETKLTVLCKADEDKETRIRSLEKTKYWLIGAVAAVAASAQVLYHTLFGSNS